MQVKALSELAVQLLSAGKATSTQQLMQQKRPQGQGREYSPIE